MPTLPTLPAVPLVRVTKRLIIPITVLIVMLTFTFYQPDSDQEEQSKYQSVSAFQLLRAPAGFSLKLSWDVGSTSSIPSPADDFLDWGFEEDEEAAGHDHETAHKFSQWRFLRQWGPEAAAEREALKQHQLNVAAQRPFTGMVEPYLKSEHKYRSNGLVEVNLNAPHPILELIKRSQEVWDAKLRKASKTLREAVVEYQRRYGRMPPKGFDKWWKYMVEHDVQLPDEYDRINDDIAPLWGIKPRILQDLQSRRQGQPDTFTIRAKNGFVYMHAHALVGGMQESGLLRAEAQLEIVKMVEKYLPNFRATFFAHDGPSQFIDWEMKSQLLEQATTREDLEMDMEFDRRHLGWAAACPPNSPLRAQDPKTPVNLTAVWEQPKSFVYDHKATMDPCNHPSHAQLVGMLEGQGIGPMASEVLFPSFTICSSPLHADILAIANENWTEDVGPDPEWDDKTDERLVWRGSNTGVLFNEVNRWELSQRVRLVNLTNQRNGTVGVIPSPTQSTQAPGKAQQLSVAWANNAFMDIGFAGRPIQCEGEGMCESLEHLLDFKASQTKREANEYKYIMDIDGNGWSSRFKRLITNRSLILKATVFPEWYTDRIQPWVHYVPLKNDLTDLYDIMTFFRGNINGQGSHDDLAKIIATQGRRWSLNFWRKEDMAAYMLRLLMEYARVMSSDRDAATFTWADLAAAEDRVPRRAFVQRQ